MIVNAELSRAVTATNTAQQLSQAAMMEFSAHCEAGNWEAAEDARGRAMAHVEAHLDSMARMYRLLRQIR